MCFGILSPSFRPSVAIGNCKEPLKCVFVPNLTVHFEDAMNQNMRSTLKREVVLLDYLHNEKVMKKTFS